MTYNPNDFTRVFNEARRDQGFRNQEHLDAFYRYTDHRRGCQECQRPGPGMWVDDGWQPTRNSCEVADRLFAASH